MRKDVAHTIHTRFTSLIVLATLGIAVSGSVLAQSALPWKTEPSSTSAPAASAPPSHHHHHSTQPTYDDSYVASGDRKQDDRKLDGLATKFYAISSEDPKAVSKLKSLKYKVSQFRTGLKHVHYDATDISKDAQKLEWRISAQRKKLEAEAAAAAPATSAVPPPATVSPAPAVSPSAGTH